MMEITKANYEEVVMQSEGKVLIDFWAPWCMPCRMLTPIMEELAEELAGQVTIGKINVDEEPELAAKFGVMSIPMLVVLEKGAVVTQAVGVRPKEEILKMLQ